MQLPALDGIEAWEPLGASACGRVYRARTAAGEDVALKLFHEPSVRGDLVSVSTCRLQDGGWPDGVLPVLALEPEGNPEYRITPALLDRAPDGTLVPRSLQHHLANHAGGGAAEGVVRGIAVALAGMHRRGVVHGNLKPCNVMFGKGGGVFLTDWSLGNMPGVREFHFTDALLYQAPEQLTHSVAMQEGGFRWDVFAFGVLAFRLLADRFPRCHATYQKLAPPSGRECGDVRLWMDLKRVAANLWSEPEVVWPEECLLSLDPVVRDIVERCLALDAGQRPASMVEVAEVLGENVGDPETKGALPLKWSMPSWGWLAACAIFLVAAVWAGMTASRTSDRLKQATEERDKQTEMFRQMETRWEKEKEELLAANEKVGLDLATAKAEIEKLKQDQQSDAGLARTLLEASREVGDQLFVWAMEKGNRSLPPLDGRELRLKRLDGYFVDFLKRTEGMKELAEERARVRLQLAEVSIAVGDEAMAASRLVEALHGLSGVSMDPAMRMRMATNRLLLAILKQNHGSADAADAFVEARKAIEAIAHEEGDSPRIDRMLAVLDFHEARMLALGGKETEALTQLRRAVLTLNRLADAEPDIAILRSELASCHLSSAVIMEGIGNLADAREARVQAKAVLETQLKKTPDDLAVKLELAGCVGGMAEAALMAGEIETAESLSREAMTHLEQILNRQPDNVDAVIRRAVQLGLRAGLLRDRGFAQEAKEDFEEGIRALERLRTTTSEPSMISYRLALLLWQRGRMLGTEGNRSGEIEFLSRARSLLAELDAAKGRGGLRQVQIQRPAVYLLGDLGHAFQLDGQKDKAREALREALAIWEALSKSQPHNEEFTEGLVWCRQRVQDLE